MGDDSAQLLAGTLDLLILKTLTMGDLHGYGIAQNIRRLSQDALSVEEGSLYPALQRMQAKGWVTSSDARHPPGARPATIASPRPAGSSSPRRRNSSARSPPRRACCGGPKHDAARILARLAAWWRRGELDRELAAELAHMSSSWPATSSTKG